MTLTDQIHLSMVFVAIIGSGLVAGMFYAFSTFIMPALGALKPEEGIRAMQSINVKVINRWFLWVFMGTSGLCLGLLFVFALDYKGLSSVFVIAGALTYILFCFFVTGTRNVPRNSQLEAIKAQDTSTHDVWQRYLDEWTYYNHIRTAAALLACICFVFGLVLEVAAH